MSNNRLSIGISEGPSEIPIDNLLFDNQNGEQLFDSISGDIYEYSIILRGRTQIRPNQDGRDAGLGPVLSGSVKWFVPEKFTIDDIDFDLFVNSNSDDSPDASNLARIFEVADNAGMEKIAFPSIIDLLGNLSGSQDNVIRFNTESRGTSPVESPPISKPVPEGNTVISILTLGMLLGFAKVKCRISEEY